MTGDELPQPLYPGKNILARQPVFFIDGLDIPGVPTFQQPALQGSMVIDAAGFILFLKKHTFP